MKKLILMCILMMSISVSAQVAISNASSPTCDANAVVDIQSTNNKGVLLPRQTANPTGTDGLMYYNSTSHIFYYYKNGVWTPFGALSDISGLGTNVATFLATPSSSNLANAVTDETGTAGNVVLSNTPTITTPTIAQINGSTAANGTLTLSATTNGTKTTSKIAMPDNVASTSTTTGTLVVTGGVGISGAIYNGGTILSSSTSGIGYTTGSGGTVTQSVNKTQGVTLNAATGTITMNNAGLNANTTVSFVLTNSSIAANDMVLIEHVSGGTMGSYNVGPISPAAGSATIYIRNVTAGNLSEAIVLRFVIIKSSNN
jgi:hypothetical protein